MDERNANENTIQYKKKKSLNILICILALVFIYLLIYLFNFIFSGNISIYEVTKGTTASNYESQYTALILREEHEVSAAGSGYVNFFVGEGSQVYVGEDIYVIDQTGTLSSQIESLMGSQAVLNENDMSKLKDSIYSFDTSFNSNDYYDAGTFKYKLESQVLDLINSNAFSTIKEQISGTTGCVFGTADVAGILVHNIDGFENLEPEDVESSYFKKSNYSKNVIGSDTYINAGTPICKIITETNWNLIIQISNPDAFKDTDYITIEFLKDNIETQCDIELFTKSGNTYGLLTLTKYMARYVSDRYVQIQIKDDIQEGLLVPITAVFEKQFFQIPRDYLVQGGNSNEYGFNKIISGGKTNSIEFVTPQIITSDDDYVYVTTDQPDILRNGDMLVKNDSTDTFKVERKQNFNGVYCIESGYANFKVISILEDKNGNYAIKGDNYVVDENFKSTIRLYDQIVRDYTKVEEGQEVKE